MEKGQDKKKINLLIVDDDQNIRRLFRYTFQKSGIQVFEAADGHEALSFVEKQPCEVGILDIVMPGLHGIDLLKQLKERKPDMELIVMTGQASVEDATEAIRLGAYDYIRKPFSLFDMERKIYNAAEDRGAKVKNLMPSPPPSEKPGPEIEIIGESEQIRSIREMIRKISGFDSPVLIESESGTGKEVVANAIHKASPRHKEPFIAINCGALPEHLLENELFGHEKGAFTDATSQKRGLFEVAKGGTLFIDEIGEMSASLQVKLLRVLETECFRRLGGTELINTDVRIIAATNRDLLKAVNMGMFRHDLYYRLNVIPIAIPPLRQHKEDIPVLVRHFLKGKRAKKLSPAVKEMSREAMEVLSGYDWPGNVRELFNVLERALVLSTEKTIHMSDLPLLIHAGGSQGHIIENISELKRLKDIEKEHIKLVLEKSLDNKMKAARILGISRQKLYRKMAEYNLEEDNNRK